MFSLAAVLVALLGLCLTGCPERRGGHKVAKVPRDTPAASTWTSSDQEHDTGLKLSLFNGTPMMASPPDAISFSSDCGTLFVHGLDRTSNEFYVGQFEVGAEALTPTGLYIAGPDLIVSYVQSAPDGSECMVLSQVQPKGKTVRDVIYRIGKVFGESLKYRSIVPWEMLEGLPVDAIETTFTFTKPFYSWDGASILVPFNNDSGIGVISKQSGMGTYVPYPRTEIAGGWTGNAFGTLPDEDGHSKIWASFWSITNSKDDECEVYTLDLDSREWKRVFKLPWAIYRCSATAPSAEPWLVSGSYSGLVDDDAEASEVPRSGVRIPQLARVVPGAGTIDLLPLYGDPIWDIALDPFGSKVFYSDHRRKALLRLNCADGELDYDPNWFTAEDRETKLFMASGGDRCFIWRDEILIQARFTKHEDEKGYDE